MNNGAKIYHIRWITLYKTARFKSTASLITPLTETVLPALDADKKLVKKGDFRGIIASKAKNRIVNPDIVLSRIQENVSRNFRVSGDVILLDVVREMEDNNEKLINQILRSPERWIPLLLHCCGHPLSNVDNHAKKQIAERLWEQLKKISKNLPVYAWNGRFQILNENNIDWDPFGELDIMERIGTEPNVETFHAAVNKLALSGDVEGCKNMVYRMARKGFSVDAHINAASVFAFSVRGHYKKADSLCEQAGTKYGDNGSMLAHGAAVRAAACRGDHERLRQVLRKCVVGSTKKLALSCDDIFDTIWQMAEKSKDGKGAECSQLVEQMLNCTSRDAGFFRKLFREIERHVCHQHYYTALSLLEDTKRVSDCLENQKRNVFLHQLVGRLSTQLIRNHEPLHLIRDIANRVHFAFNHKNSKLRIRMYDDLLFATLMLKDMDIDDRLQYFQMFVDELDAKRERIHITFPLLASEENIDQRLSILYRVSRMGYHDWSMVEQEPLVRTILQPLYYSSRPIRNQSRLDKFARILKSYGISDRQTWLILYKWAKQKAQDELRTPEEQWAKPLSKDLRGWCRAYYSETFEIPKTATNNVVSISYDKLKLCVDQGDIAKVSSILCNNGWPIDTNYSEIVPSVLNLYLMHESWKNVCKMLEELSSSSCEWKEEASKTPMKNFHLLNVLRRMAEEESFSIRAITDYAYELRTLFPNATCHYEGFFETQNEYKKLFAKCFERQEKLGFNTTTVDELIEFLRCLVKLDLIQLHPSESLTVFFINILLKHVGWTEALNTWQKFLSSLHSPNGTVALLRYCLQQNTDESKKNLQFVIHRGTTFLSQSRITAMYLAVLIGMRRFEDAEKACDLLTIEIEPNDCLMAMRLMNSLKARSVDDQFMLDFAALCFRKLGLAKNKEAAQSMQADLMRICDTRHMGPTALRVYDLFSEHGVEMREEEKNRLATVIEKHSSLSKKWIFKPNGFLNISANDEIITKSEEARIQKKLKNSP